MSNQSSAFFVIGMVVLLEMFFVFVAFMWGLIAVGVTPGGLEPVLKMFGGLLASLALFVFLLILSLIMVAKGRLSEAKRIILNGPRQVGVGLLATLVAGIGLKYTVGYEPIALANSLLWGLTVLAYGWYGLLVAKGKS